MRNWAKLSIMFTFNMTMQFSQRVSLLLAAETRSGINLGHRAGHSCFNTWTTSNTIVKLQTTWSIPKALVWLNLSRLSCLQFLAYILLVISKYCTQLCLNTIKAPMKITNTCSIFLPHLHTYYSLQFHQVHSVKLQKYDIMWDLVKLLPSMFVTPIQENSLQYDHNQNQ